MKVCGFHNVSHNGFRNKDYRYSSKRHFMHLLYLSWELGFLFIAFSKTCSVFANIVSLVFNCMMSGSLLKLDLSLVLFLASGAGLSTTEGFNGSGLTGEVYHDVENKISLFWSQKERTGLKSHLLAAPLEYKVVLC